MGKTDAFRHLIVMVAIPVRPKDRSAEKAQPVGCASFLCGIFQHPTPKFTGEMYQQNASNKEKTLSEKFQ